MTLNRSFFVMLITKIHCHYVVFSPLAGIEVIYSTPYEACIYAGLQGSLRGGLLKYVKACFHYTISLFGIVLPSILLLSSKLPL